MHEKSQEIFAKSETPKLIFSLFKTNPGAQENSKLKTEF
jgi:hypothetical protein